MKLEEAKYINLYFVNAMKYWQDRVSDKGLKESSYKYYQIHVHLLLISYSLQACKVKL